MKSLILESILQLQNKYEKKKGYLSVNDIDTLVNDKGLFKKTTQWNNFKTDSLYKEIISEDRIRLFGEEILFGFESGVIFTNDRIIILRENRYDQFRFKYKEKIYEHLNSSLNISKAGFKSYQISLLKLQKPNILICASNEFIDEQTNVEEIKVIDDEFSVPGYLSTNSNYIFLRHNDEIEFFNELESLVEENRNKKHNNIRERLKESKGRILDELDKDANGIIDISEGNEFKILLNKHQKTILEIDRNYVKKLVKISSYLKDKKVNMQEIFNKIKDTTNESVLNEYVGIYKNELNSYNVILANGLTMLVALINDELITYEEIYESMDRINIFDSQWEKDLSQKLSDIGDGLNALMYEIEASNRRIISELSNLNYLTESGFSGLNSSITNELQSIGSNIKFNNLLTGIQSYQLYKINKNTKGLN